MQEATTSSDIIPETDKEPAYTRRSTEHEVETRADVGIRPAVRVDLELVHGSAVRIHLSESLGGGGPPGAGLAGTIGGADGSEPMDSSSDSDVGGLEEMRAELDRLVRADSGEDPPERCEVEATLQPPQLGCAVTCCLWQSLCMWCSTYDVNHIPAASLPAGRANWANKTCDSATCLK